MAWALRSDTQPSIWYCMSWAWCSLFSSYSWHRYMHWRNDTGWGGESWEETEEWSCSWLWTPQMCPSTFLKHCIRCSSVFGALGVSLQSGKMVSLSLCIRARDQRMNAVVTDLSLSFPCWEKSFHTSCWSIYSLLYKWPNGRNSQGLLPVAPLLMLSWLCDYCQNFTDSSAVHYRLHLSILNQPLIQLTEMLSGKLYVPQGYQTFFWIWLKTFTHTHSKNW